MTQEQVHEVLSILSFLDIKLTAEEKTVCKFLMLRHREKQPAESFSDKKPVEKMNHKPLKENK